MLKAGVEAIRQRVTPGTLSDPDVVRYAALVSVWGRWFVWLVTVFLLAYRPGFWYPEDIELLFLPVLLGMLNGLLHHRLLTNRSVTWRWMLFLSATDIALITFGIVIAGGFRSFIFLAYRGSESGGDLIFAPIRSFGKDADRRSPSLSGDGAPAASRTPRARLLPPRMRDHRGCSVSKVFYARQPMGSRFRAVRVSIPATLRSPFHAVSTTEEQPISREVQPSPSAGPGSAN